MSQFCKQLKQRGCYEILGEVSTKDINIILMKKPLYPSFPVSDFYGIIESEIDWNIKFGQVNIGNMGKDGLELSLPSVDIPKDKLKEFTKSYTNIVSQIDTIENKLKEFCKKHKIKKEQIYFYRIHPTYG